VLGATNAALGNKEDAIHEGRRAVELVPVTKDSPTHAQLVQYLAIIYALTGEKNLAFEQLAIAARIPGYLSYGELRLHPRWTRCAATHASRKSLPSSRPRRISHLIGQAD
jgi:serine/threonine-protein kinase